MSFSLVLTTFIVSVAGCGDSLLNDNLLAAQIEEALTVTLPPNPTCGDLLNIAPFICLQEALKTTCCDECVTTGNDKTVLRIAGPDVSVPPFWEYDETKTGEDRFGGFFYSYMKEIITYMGADIQVVPQSYPRFLTGAALIGEDSIDMTPTWLSHYHYSASTQSKVSISLPLVEVQHQIVVRKYESGGGMWGIFDPYTTELWLLICGGILASAFVFWLVESRYATKMTRTPSGAFGALYFALTTLMIGGEGYEVVTWLGRFLRIGTLFYVLIIQSTYTANLASILTAKTIRSDGPTTLEEAQNSVVCCPYGKVDVSCHNDLWIAPPDKLVGTQEGIDWCSEKLLSKTIDGVMADALTLAALLSNNCGTLKPSGVSFNPTMLSLAVHPSQTILLQSVNAAIVQTKFSGRYSDLFEQFHPEECPEYVDEGEEAVVGISHMSGLFIIFAVVCALVVCLWVGRMILEKVGVMEPRKCTEIVALPDQMILEATVGTKEAIEELTARQEAFEKQLRLHLNMEPDDRDNSSNSRPLCTIKYAPDESECGTL